MFSLRDLPFMLCSRDLDVLRAQRIMGFFYLIYPQISEAGKSDDIFKSVFFPCLLFFRQWVLTQKSGFHWESL